MKRLFKTDFTAIDTSILVALTMLVVGFSVTLIADYDFWWHINLGRAIWESRSIVPVDTFSYTFSGTRQFNSEWLSDCIFYLLFSEWGYLGVNLLKVVLLLAIGALLMKIHEQLGEKEKAWFHASVITLVITLFALRFRLFIRPYLFSFLFLAAFLYLLTRHEARAERKTLLALPIIELFWANLSKGAFFGPIVIACYLIAVLVRKERYAKEVLAVLVATVAASLVNPESYNIYLLIINFAAKGADVAMVGEQQPLSPQILWGYGFRYTFGYQLLVLGSVAYFLFLKGWRNVFHLLLFVAFLLPSLAMVRMIDFFSIVGSVFTFRAVQCLAGALSSPLARHRTLVATAFLGTLLLLIALCVPDNRTYTFGLGAKEGSVPEGAIDFLDRQGLTGHLFNSYAFGGYLAWRSPSRQVFIDGRINQLYPTAFHKEYFRIIEDAREWERAAARWDFSIALVEYDLKSQWRHFPRHLIDNPQWALVYWDNHSLVYVKRTPERARLIAACEYRLTRPTFLDLSYLDQYQGGRLNDALAMLEREVALNPNNQFVLLARVYLRYQLGKLYLPQVRADLERVLPMKPDFAMKHSALAMVLAADGERGRAATEVRRALALDPLDAGALAQAKSLGISVKIPKGGIPGHP